MEAPDEMTQDVPERSLGDDETRMEAEKSAANSAWAGFTYYSTCRGCPGWTSGLVCVAKNPSRHRRISWRMHNRHGVSLTVGTHPFRCPTRQRPALPTCITRCTWL